MTETNPFLLGVTLKDLDSNVRSEISYLDRNLTAGMNTNTGNIVQNTTAQGEIMKQSSENTASLQLESLKNKDALSSQLHCTYEKLSALNTDLIRDNLDDYRAEYTGIKYGDFHRGHIHNNLHSHMGREGFGRDGFGREGR